jgi:photosystem II stability/assembly factor-like uncharacterized protein
MCLAHKPWHLNDMSFRNYRWLVAMVVFFSSFSLCGSLFAQTWTSMGPLGGDVRSLTADPSEPRVLYLGTADGYIFSSQDAGEHWRSLGLVGPASGVITAIIVDPRDSGTLVASMWTKDANGEGGGVFISRDSGSSWRGSGLEGHAIRALVQSASEPDVLVAGALDAIFRSNDLGRNWEQITPSGDSELRNFDSLALDPRDPGIIYAGTFHLAWKTLDGGKNWAPIHRGMIDDSDVLSLAVDALDPQRVFASACSGIYRSEDAGSYWNKVEGIPFSSRRTLAIRQDPQHPFVLFAGTTEGLWRTMDGGARWRRVSPRDWVINSLIIQPIGRPSPASSYAAESSTMRFSEEQTRVLIGTEQRGVLASDDGGDHFRELNEGFHHRRIVSLAIDADTPGRVAAVLANSPDSPVETEDGGRTWSTISAGLNANAITRIFSSPRGWLAALASGGFARFDDQNRRWTRVGTIIEKPEDAAGRVEGPEVHARRFDAVVNDLACDEARCFAATREGLFSTSDNGNTWAALSFTSANLPVNSVRVSADSQKLRIVSSNAMIFSDDAGRTWKWHDLPLDSGGATRLEWGEVNTLIAAARNGLYISRDDGASWEKLQSGLPAAAPEDLLIHADVWLVSMRGRGLFISRNEGASWTRVKELDGWSADDQFTILANGINGEFVYAGSANDGLYILDLLGQSVAGTFESAQAGK